MQKNVSRHHEWSYRVTTLLLLFVKGGTLQLLPSADVCYDRGSTFLDSFPPDLRGLLNPKPSKNVILVLQHTYIYIYTSAMGSVNRILSS